MTYPALPFCLLTCLGVWPVFPDVGLRRLLASGTLLPRQPSPIWTRANTVWGTKLCPQVMICSRRLSAMYFCTMLLFQHTRFHTLYSTGLLHNTLMPRQPGPTSSKGPEPLKPDLGYWYKFRHHQGPLCTLMPRWRSQLTT